MARLRVLFQPPVLDRARSLSARDREVVRDNVAELQENPQVGHPSSLSSAPKNAWQHNCPHSFVVLYRWGNEQDPAHPVDSITVENVVDRY